MILVVFVFGAAKEYNHGEEDNGEEERMLSELSTTKYSDSLWRKGFMCGGGGMSALSHPDSFYSEKFTTFKACIDMCAE